MLETTINGLIFSFEIFKDFLKDDGPAGEGGRGAAGIFYFDLACLHFLLSEPDKNGFVFFSYFCPSESLSQANAKFSKPVPKCYKTLLRTPKHLDICKLLDESMLWNKGIVRNLDSTLLNKYGNITIDINMDGLLVTKSARSKFWPVLSRPVYTDNNPFLIDLYMGEWEQLMCTLICMILSLKWNTF